MIKQLNILILTMFGIGNSKYAPGTMASFVTCLLFIYLYNSQIDILLIILFIFFVFIFSVYSIDTYKSLFSEIDSKEIVVDEFIGQSIPILTIYNLIEENNSAHFIFYTLIAFFFFRIFDVMKPYPINKIDQNMKNGFGVILDDIIAGIYSALVLLIIIFYTNHA